MSRFVKLVATRSKLPNIFANISGYTVARCSLVKMKKINTYIRVNLGRWGDPEVIIAKVSAPPLLTL